MERNPNRVSKENGGAGGRTNKGGFHGKVARKSGKGENKVEQEAL